MAVALTGLLLRERRASGAGVAVVGEHDVDAGWMADVRGVRAPLAEATFWVPVLVATTVVVTLTAAVLRRRMARARTSTRASSSMGL